MADGVGALVLAAGMSTRARPILGDRPKVLLDIGGMSVLERNLRWLASSGLHRVWINLHYGAELVRGTIGDGAHLGLDVRYSLEPELLGTAGAFKKLASEWSGTTMVVYGDNLLRFDLARFLQRHRAAAADATIAVFSQDEHRHSGIAGGRVEIGHDGRVWRFVEGDDAASGFVNAGAYLLEPQILQLLSADVLDFASDGFPLMLERHSRLFAHVIETGGYCLGFDTPESLRRAMALVDSGEVALA